MVGCITPIGEVEHCALWRVALDAPDALQWQSLLSDAERARAARFVFERDRLRYRAAHGALRHLLGIGGLGFAEGEFGKPFLRERPGVAFNLSHSQSVALVAIGKGEIGVDVELLRPMEDMPALAAAHFSAAEQRALADTTPDRQSRVFLEIWTRKEACVKALGAGLSIDTRSFHVGPAGAPIRVDAGTRGALALSSFDIGPDAIASIARVLDIPAAPEGRGQRAEEACT